jgi:hypothetical protein
MNAEKLQDFGTRYAAAWSSHDPTAVDFSGYEEWTLGQDGLVAVSKGHFEEAEYQRQLESSR